MPNFEDNLKIIMDSIINGFNNEICQNNSDNIENLKILYNNDKNLYIENIQRKLYEFNEIIKAPIVVKDIDNEGLLEYILNGLYEHFIERYIEEYEGGVCAGDKSSFIRNMTLKALEDGENKTLYYTYEGIEDISKDKWNEQAYWSPKTIKDTNEAIELFWKWFYVK